MADTKNTLTEWWIDDNNCIVTGVGKSHRFIAKVVATEYSDLIVSAPEQQACIDRLEAEKAELVEALARLDRIAALILDDHHQNLVTSDSNWKELYLSRVEARAVIAKATTNPKPEVQ